MTQMQKCVVSALNDCTKSTSANIVDSLFNFIRSATPCKDLKKVSVVLQISLSLSARSKYTAVINNLSPMLTKEMLLKIVWIYLKKSTRFFLVTRACKQIEKKNLAYQWQHWIKRNEKNILAISSFNLS